MRIARRPQPSVNSACVSWKWTYTIRLLRERIICVGLRDIEHLCRSGRARNQRSQRIVNAMTFQRSRFVLPRYVNAAVSLRRRAHPGLPDTVDVAMVEIEN